MGETSGIIGAADMRSAESSPPPLIPVCNIVTPVGMLGYGLNEHHTAAVLQRLTTAPSSSSVPTVLILDSGSTDGGPDKLALGSMTAPRSSYVRDLTKLLKLVDEFQVKLIFSSAGGDGSDEHVKEMLGVIEEIAGMEGNEHYNLKTLALFSSVDKSLVLDRLCNGAVSGCGKAVPPLMRDDVELAPRVLAQMGPEPFLTAMREHPDLDVIVGGRAYDPSPYVAYAAFASNASLENTSDPQAQRLWGGFTHMGKIMECGGICAVPKSMGASATVYSDGTFDVTPLDPEARCTATSVSAHTLYEKTRPDVLFGPGGFLDLTASSYEPLQDGRTCRVRGGLFTFSRDVGLPYQVKLEAATVVGYRAMYMGSIKDPILIDQFDNFLERVKEYARLQHESVEAEWELDFNVYGQGQVSALPGHVGEPSELFLVGEALAPSQDLANSIIQAARVATIHGPYPSQKATSGNFAHGIGGKLGIELGPCARFSVYHLMDLKMGEEGLVTPETAGALFKKTIQNIGRGLQRPSTNGTPVSLGSAEPMVQQDVEKKNVNGVGEGSEDRAKAPETLGDLARVIRSKNAGPYEVTFDILFGSRSVFQLVKRYAILNASVVAGLLEVREDNLIWCGFFDQALAFKATIPRMRKGRLEPNGGFLENDVHGSQRYLGLMNMKLPEAFVEEWKVVSGSVDS